MARKIHLLLCTIMLGGCAATLAGFKPLVGPQAGEPRCETRTPPERWGAKAISLAYGKPARQRVTVIVDDDGTPIRYSDVRGHLVRLASDTVGDFTSISLNLSEGGASGVNNPKDGEPESFRLPYSDALVSSVLANPEEKIAEVLQRCAGASYRAPAAGD